MAACFLCLFLVVSWINLQSVIVAFPSQTHLFFGVGITYLYQECIKFDQKVMRYEALEAFLGILAK